MLQLWVFSAVGARWKLHYFQLIFSEEVPVEGLGLGKTVKINMLELSKIERMSSKNILMVSVKIIRSLRSELAAEEKERRKEKEKKHQRERLNFINKT